MKSCVICGKEIETKNKKYCSIECKSKAMSKPKGNCSNCGKPLDRCETKYCSRKCFQESRHKKIEETFVYNKCTICGNLTRNKKYCSMKCLGKDDSRNIVATKNLKNNHIWTLEEINYLKNNYGKENLSSIENHLGIKKEAITTFASKHKIKSNRKWTSEEVSYLKENKNISPIILSQKMNRSLSSISNKFAIINGFRDKSGKVIISPQDYVTNYIRSLNIPYLEEVKIGNFKTDVLVYFIDFEIQGTYWHCDERFIDRDNLPSNLKDRVEKDIRKKQYFESIGIKIVYIWEYDLISNPEETLKKIRNNLIENNLLKGRPN